MLSLSTARTSGNTTIVEKAAANRKEPSDAPNQFVIGRVVTDNIHSSPKFIRTLNRYAFPSENQEKSLDPGRD
jgi:hypothetical protein